MYQKDLYEIDDNCICLSRTVRNFRDRSVKVTGLEKDFFWPGESRGAPLVFLSSGEIVP